MHQVVEAMKDEERAAMVIAMSVGLRKEAAAAIVGRLWERTMDIIKNHSGHAARCAVVLYDQTASHLVAVVAIL
jgi:hypothetical protein